MGRRACLARCRLNHGGKREKECKLTYSNCRALFWLVDVLVHADHIGHCMTEYFKPNYKAWFPQRGCLFESLFLTRTEWSNQAKNFHASDKRNDKCTCQVTSLV